MNAKDVAREIREECLAVRTRMLSRIVSGVFDEELRPCSIRTSQLNVLVAVASLEPVPPGVVADRLDLEKSTLSRNLAIMQKNGWIRVERSGRSHTLRLAPGGAALLVAVRPRWRKAQKRTEALLGSSAAVIHRAAARAGK